MVDSTIDSNAKVAVPTRTLDALVRGLGHIDGVRREDLDPGDRIIVSTRNSIYCIHALEDDLFLVAGGWFDIQGDSPQQIAVNGCTLGGTAILSDLIAAPGLFLEFGNRVKTTRIRKVRLIRRAGRDLSCN